MKPSLKRGIKYAESKYQEAGKKIRKAGGAVKKAIGDFRPGPATGYYRSKTVRETAATIGNLFKGKK